MDFSGLRWTGFFPSFCSLLKTNIVHENVLPLTFTGLLIKIKRFIQSIDATMGGVFSSLWSGENWSILGNDVDTNPDTQDGVVLFFSIFGCIVCVFVIIVIIICICFAGGEPECWSSTVKGSEDVLPTAVHV